jgi:hypothetical protein
VLRKAPTQQDLECHADRVLLAVGVSVLVVLAGIFACLGTLLYSALGLAR